MKHNTENELQALRNALDSFNLTGYEVHEWMPGKHKYFLMDDKANCLTGHWDYSELNHFIMGYGKALKAAPVTPVNEGQQQPANDFLEDAVNSYFHQAIKQLERKDLGDIERKNWEGIRNKCKEFFYPATKELVNDIFNDSGQQQPVQGEGLPDKKAIVDSIYKAYGSDSGVLFGIKERSIVEAIVEFTINRIK